MKPIIIAAVLGALTLTGCGKQTELQRPGPLYGPAARADASADAN